MRRTLLAAAALTLAACGSPDYYLLPQPAAAPRTAAPVGTIAIADISLPAYAGALEIASLTGPETLHLDKKALWADSPQRALTRQLAAALEARLGADVGTEPWPGFDSPGLRVEVTVDRMIGAPGGSLDFAGQYAIVAPSSGRIVAFDRFAITVPPQGDGYPGLLADHARAIESLADRIAASITGRRRPSS
ncbi:MAG: PqiC family protein [Amaricoccus sp.]